MTALLDTAFEVVRQLPPDEQDEIARVIMALASAGPEAMHHVLTDEERAAVNRSRLMASRGQFASDEQVAAVWAKYGL